MERQGKKTRRWRHQGRTFMALAGLAALGVQAAIPNPERVHEFVQTGRVKSLSLPVAKAENQLQAKDGFAAFVTADSLYVQELEEICLVGICGGACLVRPRTTLAVPLPAGGNGQIPAMGLLRVAREGSDEFPANVHVALAMPGGRLHRENFHRSAAGRLTRTAGMPALTLKVAEPWVRAFADLREAYPGDPRQGFLILGRDGRMSLVDENLGRLIGMTETVLESGTSTDLTAQGGGWVGTSTGGIHRLAGTAALPRLDSRGTPAPGRPILSIGSRSALVKDGFLLYRQGAWSVVRPGPSGLIGVLAQETAEGTRIRRFTESGAESAETWDTPTTLEYRAGSGAWSPPGDRPIRPDLSSRKTYQVAFRDPDRNPTPPSLELFHNDAGIALFRGAAQADPALGCLQSGRCLPGAETLLTLEMSGDSVLLSMEVLEGVRSNPLPLCMLQTFTGGPVRFLAAERWAQGSWLNVRVGGQVLTFMNGEPMGLAKGRAAAGRNPAGTGYRDGFGFLATGPDGKVYGATGRVRTRETSRFPRPAAP